MASSVILTKMEEPRTAFLPLLGLISLAYWWKVRRTVSFYIHHQWNTCSFNRNRQGEAAEPSRLLASRCQRGAWWCFLVPTSGLTDVHAQTKADTFRSASLHCVVLLVVIVQYVVVVVAVNDIIIWLILRWHNIHDRGLLVGSYRTSFQCLISMVIHSHHTY